MKKKMTPAAVNKMIKKLQSEKDYLLSIESASSIFYEVDGESVAPEYDFAEMNSKLNRLDDRIAQLRHSVNLFNTRTRLKDSAFTLDEALVRMAQLNARKQKLDTMRKRLPRQKSDDRYSSRNYVEYVCANYDIDVVKKEYAEVEDMISELQMKIDYINQTRLIEIDID